MLVDITSRPGPLEHEGLTIAVSFIDFNSETYLSGFRTSHRGQPPYYSSAGIITPSKEASFCLGPNDAVTGIDVVLSALGIYGLRLRVKRAGLVFIQDIGDVAVRNSHRGIASLVSKEKTIGLSVKFDVFWIS
jgi:hypothetical protein